MPNVAAFLRRSVRRAGRVRGRPAGAAPRPAPDDDAATQGRGRPPEVARESTHLGPELDAAVFRARRRMRVGADPDYDLVQERFDALHYLLQVPRLLERPRVDPVAHFLESGQAHHRSPEPDFSMRSYLTRHPERGEGHERSPYLAWLKEGRAAGEIADPAPGIEGMAHLLGRTPAEVVELLVDRRTDLRDRLRTGELGDMVNRAIEIEPLIAHARSRFTRPRLLPFGDPDAVEQAVAIHGVHERAGFRTARLVLVINRPRWGGGRRLEGHIAHALASQLPADEVVVIYTEEGGQSPAGRFPDGVREIDFATLVAGLEPEHAEAALVILLRTFRADAIVNINSGTLYRAMQAFGRALTASERVFLCFFCNEQTPSGAWVGWSLRYFYRFFEQVTGVITDSDHLVRELTAAYRVPESGHGRLHVLRAPVEPTLPLVAEPPDRAGRRPQVFWAGRWDRQKRIPLVLEVARRMPDVDFRMWGESVMDTHRAGVPDNVSREGRYEHISEIPLAEADAWLYTSGWDGVPSQLLEVSMTGIPIVGTLVGGTEEILSAEHSWPVDAAAGAPAYVSALRAVLADPAGARGRALQLRERLVTERTQAGFADSVADLLLRQPGTTGGGR
jgi:glycosyltransferase involved in cell wall biosynthesis